MEVDHLSSRELLHTYAKILTTLVDRGITRSRNAPVGDLAEYLVTVAYGGTLGAPAEKSWDVQDKDGRKLQVKARLVLPGHTGQQQYSPFRSWGFDACVFVQFDALSYEVIEALEVPVAAVQQLARPVPHVGATAARLNTRSKLREQEGTVEVTTRLQSALNTLDSERP